MIVVLTTPRAAIAASRSRAGEAVEARGERDVRRRRVLALQRREAPDRLGRVEPPALEQHLAGGERGGQLRAGERPHRREPTRRGRYPQSRAAPPAHPLSRTPARARAAETSKGPRLGAPVAHDEARGAGSAGKRDLVTRNRALKQAVRERAARTGQKYSAARRAVVEAAAPGRMPSVLVPARAALSAGEAIRRVAPRRSPATTAGRCSARAAATAASARCGSAGARRSSIGAGPATRTPGSGRRRAPRGSGSSPARA